jgi:hypothetical protein
MHRNYAITFFSEKETVTNPSFVDRERRKITRKNITEEAINLSRKISQF